MEELASRNSTKEAYRQVFQSLNRYVDILAATGIEWGLLGPREGDRLWSRHVANSLAVTDAVPEGADVADIGSGAGLPGIPLAIARPDLRVTLIESLQRRVTFLEQAVADLGLEDRVTIIRGRAEEQKGHYDVVTCRAVAPLDRLLKWTTPLFLPDGQLLALKGSSAEDEVRDASKQLTKAGLVADILELRAAPDLEGTRAVRVRRPRAAS